MDCSICKREYSEPSPSSLKTTHYNWRAYCSFNCWVVGDFKCQHEGEHLNKEDWKDIIKNRISALQFYKICNYNYSLTLIKNTLAENFENNK